ncbi:MAG: DUF4118 domain-containing protein [Acidobacteria bacterium]|nr:DUF4118 domain-containing protein [Acidobacteriota bacterium]
MRFSHRAWRLLVSVLGVVAVTVVTRTVIAVNPTTAGFAYLLLILILATTWGFVEAAFASIIATVAFNFFFFPPVGTLTIADPQNWVALFSFLATSLIASRLSAMARRRAQDALDRHQDVERLYTFSRAILLIESTEPFPKQLTQKLADIFDLSAVVLYERRSGQFFRAGPSDFEGMDDQLRETAVHGTSSFDSERDHVITAVRLGSEPIASLALKGRQMPDSVLQGIANLVAIGLERARAQGLAHEIEAARQSERLRTTLIDAMAHEFKTPLTLIKGATTSLLDNPDQPEESRTELLRIADEEAEHLRELIDHAVELARLDTDRIDLQREPADVGELVRSAIDAMRNEIDDRPFTVACDAGIPVIALDRRLVLLAIKQLLDNAIKYAPPNTPVTVEAHITDGRVILEFIDQGEGIPPHELGRIFDRFYRSPSVERRIPGSGLGLSIAQRIAQAHGGDLTVTSHPGRTTFRLTLPAESDGL